MEKENVSNSTTGMNPGAVSGKNRIPALTYPAKPLIIADLLFLIRLFRQYPGPFPAKTSPEFRLPDVLAQTLPAVNRKDRLQQWVQTGAVSICETGDALFEEALRIGNNPGMQTTDYVALLTALHNNQSIVSSTAIITREARRLQIPVWDGNELLQNLAGGMAADEILLTRVKGNEIFLYGVPAPIAGNNSKV